MEVFAKRMRPVPFKEVPVPFIAIVVLGVAMEKPASRAVAPVVARRATNAPSRRIVVAVIVSAPSPRKCVANGFKAVDQSVNYALRLIANAVADYVSPMLKG
jgi:hypothetical protein